MGVVVGYPSDLCDIYSYCALPKAIIRYNDNSDL